MDLTSLYYFSELAKDLHMTRTANRLFISQQTLSNHILRLENYYGVKLFHRKPYLSLTYAGEYVLSYANTINREENNLKDILSDIQHQERGVVHFGASSLRMNTCLPDILPEFSLRYPNVEIRLIDTNSKQLEELVLNGDIDLAIVLHGIENPLLEKIHLMSDQIYICVSDTLLYQYYGEEINSLKKSLSNGTYVKDLSKLPFCILNNRMGQIIQTCFDDVGFVPRKYTTSSYMHISTSIGLKGLAACFATRTSLINQKFLIPEDINIFPLLFKGKPLTEQISLIHHKDRYLTNYNKYFLDLMVDYFKKLELVPIEDIAHT